jgi:protein TonB
LLKQEEASMYEAIRQRTLNSSQLAGASATVLALAATGYLVMTGLGEEIVKVIVPPTILATVPPEPADPVEPAIREQLDTTVVLDEPPPLTAPLEEFKSGEPPPITPPPATGEKKTGASVGPAPLPVRKWPVMRTTEKPPYPAPDIRGQNEGVTGLLVCVGANGRVQSATLDYSSGSSSLDQAALKWIRSVRFAPGTVDGTALAMCGHKVAYEWTLKEERGRR